MKLLGKFFEFLILVLEYTFLTQGFVVSFWAIVSKLIACTRQKIEVQKFALTLAKTFFLENQPQNLRVFKHFLVLVNFTQKLSVLIFFEPPLGFLRNLSWQICPKFSKAQSAICFLTCAECIVLLL